MMRLEGAGLELGEWRLQRCIGHSHCSDVYLATHRNELDGTTLSYVVKLVSEQAPVWARAMLQQEQRVLSMLTHPNVISLLGAGREQTVDYLVLPHLEGVLPRDGHRRPVHPRQYGRLAWVTRQVLSGLRAIHELGWCHGDLKPAHLSIDKRFHVTLMDLGMTLPLYRRPAEILSAWGIVNPGHQPPHRDEVPLLGSPPYMAPESFLNEAAIEPSRDVYALGAILYQWLTGARPYQAKTLEGWKKAHFHSRPEHPGKWAPDLSEDMTQLVLSMLAKQPARRPTLSEIEERLVRLEVDSFGEWLADEVPRAA